MRFGSFTVNVTEVKHPITQGLKPFEVTDELYFNQEGEAPIEALITARSKVTKRDEPLAWAYLLWRRAAYSRRCWATVRRPTTPSRRAKCFAAPSPGRRGVKSGTAGCRPRINRICRRRRHRPLTEGRFGKALDVPRSSAVLPAKPEYQRLPLTVECWAKLFDKQSFNILVANELKTSPSHWELFTMAGTGKLTAYLPGMQPDHVRSDADICDANGTTWP